MVLHGVNISDDKAIFRLPLRAHLTFNEANGEFRNLDGPQCCYTTDL